MNLVDIWEERIFLRPKKKKKNSLGYEKEDGEKRERDLEMLRADGMMSPASWCVPGELGPQRLIDVGSFRQSGPSGKWCPGLEHAENLMDPEGPWDKEDL